MDIISYKIHNPAKGDIVVFKTQLTKEDRKQKHLVKRVIEVANYKIKY